MDYINNTGKYNAVSDFVVDYDEYTDRYILTFESKPNLIQIKLSDTDTLNLVRILTETLWKVKEAKEIR